MYLGTLVSNPPLAESARLRMAHGAMLCTLAAVGYYVGLKLGLALTFEPYPVSVLWPPNAVLMGALLVTPARTWWLILLAMFPVHVVTELQGGVPLPMVLSWFATNALEALIGAVGLRALLGRTPSFGSVNDSGTFLVVGVVGATFVASFVDAAFVALLRWGSVGYWEVWRTRLCSNALATLVVVPVIVSWVASYRNGWSKPPRVRMTEAALLTIGLATASMLTFDSLPVENDLQLALLYSPLAFLLWAALRFGPAGASAGFMLVALAVIWGASHYRGPFIGGTAAENVFSIQVFLVVVGATLMMLAAALEERAGSLARLQETQASLRSSDERFRLVLAATSDIIYDWNLESGELWWNSNGDAYFGPRPDAPVCDEWWATRLHPEDQAHLVPRMHALEQGSGNLCEAECRLRRVDGSYAHVLWRTFAVRDEAGKALRMVGSIMDISERKRVEEAQRQLAHVSRLAVAGELTASVAHEINQPLGAILTNADAADILLEQPETPVEELRRIIDDIRADDMRAADVIRHMRELLSKRELSIEPCDLKRAIEDVLRLVSADLARLRVTVECELAWLPPVPADRIHLQQVILNLILNACDAMSAMPVGERRLGIRMTRAAGPAVEITVWDCGPGIEPDQVKRLFDSFFTTKGGGMGLGLSIARTIVEAHGGTISGGNRPEGGAAFVFSLPFVHANPVRA